MVGEDAEARLGGPRRRDDEPAVENPDRQRGRRGRIGAFVEQLVEPLTLPRVVAEDHRRHAIAHDPPQALHVAIDLVGRARREDHRVLRVARRGRTDLDPAERLERPHRRDRVLIELLARRGVLSAAAGELDVVCGLVPGALKLRLRPHAERIDHDRVGRPEIGDRHALEFADRFADAAVDRQHEGVVGRARGPLGVQIEVTHLRDLITPELEAHRIRHPESVDVEDAAAYAELGDVLDHRDPLVADRLQMRGQRLGPPALALPQLDARRANRPGETGALEDRPRGREQNAHLPAADALERFDALPGHLGMRLDFAKPLAGRIQGDRGVLGQRLEVGKPAFRFRNAIRDEHEESPRMPPRKRRDEDGIGGSVEAGNGALRTRRRQAS